MEAKDNTIVKINVGGSKFYTTLKTLTSRPGTYITELFSKPEQLLKDDEGFYFIDRNGSYFTYILDYLRGYKLNIPWDSYDVSRIIEEFQYYGLDAPKDDHWQFSTDPRFKQHLTALSDDRMSVTKIAADGYGLVLGTKPFTSGIYRWKFIIENLSNGKKDWIVFGLACHEECNPAYIQGYNFRHCWGMSTEGDVFRLEGKGDILENGDVIDCEYNADTRDFVMKCVAKGIEVKGACTGLNPYPFVTVYYKGNKIRAEIVTNTTKG